MKKFKVISGKVQTGFITDFDLVIQEMDRLQKKGVKKARISCYENGRMRVSKFYEWNGVEWEMTKANYKTY
jgi:hypothetical protein